jgi:hypothetical protein
MKNETLSFWAILLVSIAVILYSSLGIYKLPNDIWKTYLPIGIPIIGGMFVYMANKYFDSVIQRNDKYFFQKMETADKMIDIIFKIRKHIQFWNRTSSFYDELFELIEELNIIAIKYGETKIINMIGNVEYSTISDQLKFFEESNKNAEQLANILLELRSNKRLVVDKKTKTKIVNLFTNIK